MRLAAARPEPQVTAHILAQLLEAPTLAPAAVTRFEALMRREGLELAAMIRQNQPMPLRWLHEVFPDLDADEAARLGHSAGLQARLTSYSPLSLSLVSASTIHDALRLLGFLPLISNSLSARLVERGEDVAIVLDATSGDPVLDRFPVFYCASAVTRLLQLLSAEPLALGIHIAWPRPAGFPEPAEPHLTTLQFDAPLHHIAVPRRTLQAPCRFADPIAYQTELANLQARMAALAPADDLPERLRSLLDARPGLLSIDEAAQRLHLSVSTLKRRLAESGTHFRELREAVLQDRARLLLADASLSLEAISSALGYSDLANFSHAFKRWTGSAPGAFRRRPATTSQSAPQSSS